MLEMIFAGLQWNELEACVQWMMIHRNLINKHQPTGVHCRTMEKTSELDVHKIQCNTIPAHLWVSHLFVLR
jgi:hypothetical protein